MNKTPKNESIVPTLFSDVFDNAKTFGKNWLEHEFGLLLPAVNIRETNKDFCLEFAAPGFKRGDFKVSVHDNTLTIHAEKEEEKHEEHKRYTRKEFAYTSFSRAFTLPENVNVDDIDAGYNDGILKVSVPKREQSKSHSRRDIAVS